MQNDIEKLQNKRTRLIEERHRVTLKIDGIDFAIEVLEKSRPESQKLPTPLLDNCLRPNTQGWHILEIIKTADKSLSSIEVMDTLEINGLFLSLDQVKARLASLQARKLILRDGRAYRSAH